MILLLLWGSWKEFCNYAKKPCRGPNSQQKAFPDSRKTYSDLFCSLTGPSDTDIGNHATRQSPSAALVEKGILTPREWIIFGKARSQQIQWDLTLFHLSTEDISETSSNGEKGEHSHFQGERKMPVLSRGSLVLSLGCYTQCHCNHTQTSGASDVIYSEQLCSQSPCECQMSCSGST